MRTCFVHIGTHKTGTTSLQMTLNRHRDELEARHYLYPLTGRPPESVDGHHNIAWEISRDQRFRQEHGTISDLISEIRGVPYDILLSSEDFECSVHHAARFREFIERLQKEMFGVKIVICFRCQIEYSQSLYLEMLKFGIRHTFEEFLDEILDREGFRWRDWIMSFSYLDLLTILQSIPNVDIIARSYEKLEAGSLVDEFLSILGLDAGALGADTTLRTNARVGIVTAMMLFCRNRGLALDAAERRDHQAPLSTARGRAVRAVARIPAANSRQVSTVKRSARSRVSRCHV